MKNGPVWFRLWCVQPTQPGVFERKFSFIIINHHHHHHHHHHNDCISNALNPPMTVLHVWGSKRYTWNFDTIHSLIIHYISHSILHSPPHPHSRMCNPPPPPTHTHTHIHTRGTHTHAARTQATQARTHNLVCLYLCLSLCPRASRVSREQLHVDGAIIIHCGTYRTNDQRWTSSHAARTNCAEKRT